MRIIAGSAGGLSLEKVSATTRPTMDRVRGAIFSSLGNRVPGARVLDLFAGTGAMGIEALSRGAKTALFVDNSTSATALIRRNLQLTKLEGQVQQMDALHFLNLHALPGGYDLIFADPPYAKNATTGEANLAGSVLVSPQLKSVLGDEGLLILECERRQTLPETPHLEILSDRLYGESRIMIMRSLPFPSHSPE